MIRRHKFMFTHTLNPAADLDFFFKPNAFFNGQKRPSNSEAKRSETSYIRTSVDISEDKHAFYIHAELPGVKLADVKVAVDKKILTLSGKKTSVFEKPTDKNSEEGNKETISAHTTERRFGEFSRSFTLPDSVDAKKLVANFSDGVLTLKIPKKEEDVQQSFEVNISS